MLYRTHFDIAEIEFEKRVDRWRKKAIEAAVGEAQSQGLKEAEQLKARAENDRRQLRDKANAKMAPAVAKVMDYLRG